MAGILDSKSRVMDTIITSIGRKQAAAGGLKIEHVSFTDRNIYYSTGADGVVDDPTTRIYFEASSGDSDVIIWETDNLGNLTPFRSKKYSISGGKIYDLDGKIQPGIVNLVSASDNMLKTSTENFTNQMIIGSRELFRQDKKASFEIDTSNIDFSVTANSPIASEVKSMSVDNIESVFQDFRFGNMDAFKFMPPVAPDVASKSLIPMASYSNVNQANIDTWEEMQNYLSGKPVQTVNFIQKSIDNNLIGQALETDNEEQIVKKLSIIDMGTFKVDDTLYPHVFFLGKIYRDSKGNLTFANLFTLVFE